MKLNYSHVNADVDPAATSQTKRYPQTYNRLYKDQVDFNAILGGDMGSQDENEENTAAAPSSRKKSGKRVLPWQVGASKWEPTTSSSTAGKKKTTASTSNTDTKTSTKAAPKRVSKKRRQETAAFEKAKQGPTIPKMKVPRSRARKIKTEKNEDSLSEDEEEDAEEILGVENDDEDEVSGEEQANTAVSVADLKTLHQRPSRLTATKRSYKIEDSTDDDEDVEDSDLDDEVVSSKAAPSVTQKHKGGKKSSYCVEDSDETVDDDEERGQSANAALKTKPQAASAASKGSGKETSGETLDSESDDENDTSSSTTNKGTLFEKMFSKAAQHLMTSSQEDDIENEEGSKEIENERVPVSTANSTHCLSNTGSVSESRATTSVTSLVSTKNTEPGGSDSTSRPSSFSSTQSHSYEARTLPESTVSEAPSVSEENRKPRRGGGSLKNRLQALKEKTSKL